MAIDLVGLPEAAYSKDDKENKREEDDKSHLHSKRNIQKQYHNPKQSTISDFMT